METQELHRGRPIDHLQFVVKDLAASKRFYCAVFSVLDIPMGGEGEGYFWADELFISGHLSLVGTRSRSSPASRPTYAIHSTCLYAPGV